MSDELTVVVVDRELARGRVTGHILIDEGKDGLSSGLVVGEDSLRAKKAALLTGVEVELEGVLGLEASVGENAESLKDDNDTRAVVVSTGSTGSGRSSGGVEVGTNND